LYIQTENSKSSLREDSRTKIKKKMKEENQIEPGRRKSK
jgi:hypothetical protein